MSQKTTVAVSDGGWPPFTALSSVSPTSCTPSVELAGCTILDMRYCCKPQDKQQLQLVILGTEASELSATCEVCTPTACTVLCTHLPDRPCLPIIS